MMRLLICRRFLQMVGACAIVFALTTIDSTVEAQSAKPEVCNVGGTSCTDASCNGTRTCPATNRSWTDCYCG